ncbi:MAG: YihA family ribosome biogenesis GTP-binding protein [Alphaproteobacteria bacterium]|nr:YihA family ribosome biogenesis GTP-binding protein [Alphaproteobacteria bacterium]
MLPSLAPSTALERPDAKALEAGRWLFAQECRFLMGVAELGKLPAFRLPEIAFAGRSNVGKSSLLNALVGRKDLARTSNTPGRTQELNFFDLGRRLTLVDLPGYGHAEAPKARIEAWNALVRDYLRGRPTLARVCLLIDARHGLKPVDGEIMTLLDEAAVVYHAVLTKADKPKPKDLAAVEAGLRAEIAKRPAAHPAAFVTSSVEGTGLPELRAALASLAGRPL